MERGVIVSPERILESTMILQNYFIDFHSVLHVFSVDSDDQFVVGSSQGRSSTSQRGNSTNS